MATAANPTRDDFAKMLDEQLGGAGDEGFEGRVVKGTVTAIENGMAHIDVGLKSEGRVDLKEFQRSETETAPGVGDEVEVFEIESAGSWSWFVAEDGVEAGVTAQQGAVPFFAEGAVFVEGDAGGGADLR